MLGKRFPSCVAPPISVQELRSDLNCGYQSVKQTVCCRTHQKNLRVFCLTPLDNCVLHMWTMSQVEQRFLAIKSNALHLRSWCLWVKSVRACREFLFQVCAWGKSAPKCLCSKRVLVLLDQSHDIPASEVITVQPLLKSKINVLLNFCCLELFWSGTAAGMGG